MDSTSDKKRKAPTGTHSATKKTKSDKGKAGAVVAENASLKAQRPISTSSTSKISPKTTMTTIDVELSESDNESDDNAVDDADLLAGFESDEEDEVSSTPPQVSNAGKLAHMKIPTKIMSGVSTQTSLQKGNKDDLPGAVYLGRIPHGFYEHEMRAYFSQFGTITRLRLSRNKTTGKSKHYAFIEFGSSSVAQIVADTMNNYLLFGHILKCKVIPQEQCNEKMWIGANRRWKVVPLARLRKIRNDSKRPQEVWDKLEEKELKRRKTKESKWKEAGIAYSLEPSKSLPALETVDSSKKPHKKASKT